MNLIRIFAKKFGDEVVIPQTETQKDRSNQKRWKRLFQRFLKTRFPMKASLIAFQLS